MSGLKPAVVGLIGAAVVSTASAVFFPDGFSTSVLTTSAFLVSAFIFALMLFLSRKNVHPILIILISAALGIVSGFLF
jgi:chromate transporter